MNIFFSLLFAITLYYIIYLARLLNNGWVDAVITRIGMSKSPSPDTIVIEVECIYKGEKISLESFNAPTIFERYKVGDSIKVLITYDRNGLPDWIITKFNFIRDTILATILALFSFLFLIEKLIGY